MLLRYGNSKKFKDLNDVTIELYILHLAEYVEL